MQLVIGMVKVKTTGKYFKRVLSLVLILSVILSLAVPFTVHAAEQEPATGNDIYALAYKINPNNQSVWSNIEIVFQKGDTRDPSKEYLKTFSNFADDQFDNKPPWTTLKPTGSGNSFGSNAKRFVIKDKIQPMSISGWFRDTWALEEIQGLENLDTSECTDMSGAFSSLSFMKKLDLSSFDTSKVVKFDGMINSNAIESVNVSGFKFDSCQSLVSFIRGNKLTEINLSGIDVSKCTTIKAFVTNCAALEELDCTSFNPRNVELLQNAFCSNASLKSIKFGEFQPGIDNDQTYIKFNKMFLDCPSLEEIDFATFDLPKT